MTYLDTSLALPEELIVKICAEHGDADTLFFLRFLSKKFNELGTSEQECKALAGRATWLGVEFFHRKSGWETWQALYQFSSASEYPDKVQCDDLKNRKCYWNFLFLKALRSFNRSLGRLASLASRKERGEERSITILFGRVCAEYLVLGPFHEQFKSDCSEAPLKQLERGLPEFSKLTQLAVGEISYLPGQIGQLTSLTKLSLLLGRCTTLPQEIGNLTLLKELHLLSNRFTELPEQISTLVQLETLMLERNALNRLPAWISTFTSLKSLDLSDNCFELWSDPLTSLSGLTFLNLAVNRFQLLSESIGRLTSLTKLNIGQNRLRLLPDSLFQLRDLRKVTLSNDLIELYAGLIAQLPDVYFCEEMTRPRIGL